MESSFHSVCDTFIYILKEMKWYIRIWIHERVVASLIYGTEMMSVENIWKSCYFCKIIDFRNMFILLSPPSLFLFFIFLSLSLSLLSFFPWSEIKLKSLRTGIIVCVQFRVVSEMILALFDARTLGSVRWKKKRKILVCLRP